MRRKRAPKSTSLHERIRAALRAVKRLLTRRGPENPDDPYALVMAPAGPRPPSRSASAAAKPEA